ncbi:hypothetical protein SAMN04487857_1322 [Pseudomonas sp. ok272]|uniref:hypothetical protein n=1 Tax=unclassified Pseudomonas TaxID=196821 RepID=UPI0008B583D0|nr:MULTISPECIES: hypothetical protein [unclassified Pseudomonas]SEN65661.1 hypothetical protein SAMN04487857_1322 [Pseudomonas sp. ok272]SFN46002.1 hypothetical protein SAMN04487858_1342 [Pseudomonas sp. ok602]
MDNFYRIYLAKEDHLIDVDALAQALESFEGVALKFSADFIKDSEQRSNYNRNIQRVKAGVLAEVSAGRVSVKEASQFCYEMRNKIMTEIRYSTSIHGQAFALKKKQNAPALEKLLNNKALDSFGKQFSSLSEQQKNVVHYGVIESSARSSAGYNTMNKVLNITGKVLIVVTITYAAYEIINAENKIKESIKHGSIIGGGFVGTALAGAVASAFCGPGAPLCVVASMLIGGAGGAWLTSKGTEYFDLELDEFTRWSIR